MIRFDNYVKQGKKNSTKNVNGLRISIYNRLM